MANQETSDQDQPVRGVAAGIVDQPPTPGPEHKRLEVIIGKWINEGHTVAAPGAPSVKITASDTYEWAPGRFFVLHPAYGRIGDVGVGGVEILSYDAASKKYRSQLFDSQGNIGIDELTIEGDTWIWQGEKTRCTAVFTNNGKTQTAHHERLDEHGNWVPSMEVVLTKIQ